MSFYADKLREHGNNDFDHEIADEIERLEAQIDRMQVCLRECDAALGMLSSLGSVVALRCQIAVLV